MQSGRQERSERKRSLLLKPCFVSYLQPGKPLGAKRGLHPTEALQRGTAAATARAHLSTPGPCRSLPGWRTKGEVFLWDGSCCHEPMDEMGSGGKMSASAARLSITGGVRWSAATAHLSSAPHNWFGSGHTTSLFKIKIDEASICLGAPLLFVWIHCMH